MQQKFSLNEHWSLLAVTNSLRLYFALEIYLLLFRGASLTIAKKTYQEQSAYDTFTKEADNYAGTPTLLAAL